MIDIRQAGGTLVSASGTIRAARDKFDTDARTLQANISGMASGWTGQGGSAFQSLALRWQERHREISRVLGDLAEGLDGTDRQSRANDEAIGAGVTAIARGLG